MRLENITKHPRIVIIGGGFGGIELAKTLEDADVEILLLDKHNYHTFQPLLYQVAMGSIQAESIAFPLRRIFQQQKNLNFVLAEVLNIRTHDNCLETSVGNIKYDYLVIATGSNTNFFGNEQIEHNAMPMKNITEALNLRMLILQNLEAAFLEDDPQKKEALLNFVIVGGGPTGVELAGAIAEFRNHVLCKDYPEHKKEHMKVFLIEGKSEVLAVMSEKASKSAKDYLLKFGVEVSNAVHVKSYDGEVLTIDDGRTIRTKTVIWAAGVKGEIPKGFSPGEVTKGNRIQVDVDNRVHSYKNVFAIGDAAAMITIESPQGHPGVAPVAIQQGEQLAKNLIRLIKGETTKPFVYHDKGSLATIGRNKAVADLGKIHLSGFFAWLMWMFVHLLSLVGFSNKFSVFVNWLTSYFTYNGDNRLIIRRFDKKLMKIDPDAN